MFSLTLYFAAMNSVVSVAEIMSSSCVAEKTREEAALSCARTGAFAIYCPDIHEHLSALVFSPSFSLILNPSLGRRAHIHTRKRRGQRE